MFLFDNHVQNRYKTVVKKKKNVKSLDRTYIYGLISVLYESISFKIVFIFLFF